MGVHNPTRRGCRGSKGRDRAAPQPHEGAFSGRLEDEAAGGYQPLLAAVPHPFR